MIKLSKKWDYLLKAIIYMATKKDEILKISQISDDLYISLSLLRQILSQAEKKWIITSIKWRNWGVIFKKELKDISIYDILYSVWEDLNISECSKWLDCKNINICNTSKAFIELQRWFNTLLKIYTLDKIIK